MELEFRECSVCASKPGSPTLCESCLSNRSTIEQLKQKSVKYLYLWYKKTHDEEPYEFPVAMEDDSLYVKGLADGLENEDLKKIAARMKEHARFLRCLNQRYNAECDARSNNGLHATPGSAAQVQSLTSSPAPRSLGRVKPGVMPLE